MGERGGGADIGQGKTNEMRIGERRIVGREQRQEECWLKGDGKRFFYPFKVNLSIWPRLDHGDGDAAQQSRVSREVERLINKLADITRRSILAPIDSPGSLSVWTQR